MMMPTWAGTTAGSASAALAAWVCEPATSVNLYLHDLRLPRAGDFVDTFDEAIGQLLQPLLSPAFVFFRDARVLFGLSQVVQGVAAAVAHRDPCFLSAVMNLLDQLL